MEDTKSTLRERLLAEATERLTPTGDFLPASDVALAGLLTDAAAALDHEAIARTASHIERALEYIEKVYPDARQLDRGPLLRNMRRWAKNLRDALGGQV